LALLTDADFEAFVLARGPALTRAAYLLTGDAHAAEDLLQTALAKTYARWGRIRELDAVDAYVRRAMVHTRTSWWRSRRGREMTTAEPPERPVAGPDVEGWVWPYVLALPPRQRAAVVLRYYLDLPEADVAAALGCSTGTVRSQTSKAVAKLRVALRDELSTSVDNPNIGGAMP
jgi:RNA polymerase sigma-70 factor (sigma-E family)